MTTDQIASPFSCEERDLAAALLAACRREELMLATAESCTGGLIAACLTDIAGSSDVVDRAFVTYSNAAKTDLVGVSAGLIESHGAVSEAVCLAMAEGAVARSQAGLGIAVTGVAGPGGGSADKPVGLVHVAVARRGGQTTHQACRFGDIGRAGIRARTLEAALRLALAAI